MAERTTFIELDKNILDWRWWHDSNTLKVFLYLIIKANVTDNDFETITVHRGQLVTSVDSIRENCCLSVSQVRTILKRLKAANEITIKATNKYSIVTVLNYDKYQREED